MRLRVLLLAAALAVSACQTVPVETEIVQTEAAEADPLDVAVPISENPSEGMTENDWGGEIPQSQPTGEVDEGGLGDLD